MKRPLRPEELRVWGVVAATIRPLAGRVPPPAPPASAPAPASGAKRAAATSPPVSRRTPSPPADEPRTIEPGRLRRLARERDPIAARLDLHGLDQDRARAALEGFLRRAWDDGLRAVLVITGKGTQGDGVLRRRAPEWLAAPGLAPLVAGVSEASRRHGGEGALYVALRRKPKP